MPCRLVKDKFLLRRMGIIGNGEQSIMYIIHCSMYTIHCTRYNIYDILYIVQCTPIILYNIKAVSSSGAGDGFDNIYVQCTYVLIANTGNSLNTHIRRVSAVLYDVQCTPNIVFTIYESTRRITYDVRHAIQGTTYV